MAHPPSPKPSNRLRWPPFQTTATRALGEPVWVPIGIGNYLPCHLTVTNMANEVSSLVHFHGQTTSSEIQSPGYFLNEGVGLWGLVPVEEVHIK